MTADKEALLTLIDELSATDDRFFIRIRPALAVGRLQIEVWCEDENGYMVGVADEIGRDANRAAAAAGDRVRQWRARASAEATV